MPRRIRRRRPSLTDPTLQNYLHARSTSERALESREQRAVSTHDEEQFECVSRRSARLPPAILNRGAQQRQRGSVAAAEKRAAVETLPLSQIGPTIAAKILMSQKR